MSQNITRIKKSGTRRSQSRDLLPKREVLVGITNTRFVFRFLVQKLLVLLLILPLGVHAAPARLKLYRKTIREDRVARTNENPTLYETDSRSCPAGVFLSEPTEYSCACVTGIWGFYTKYCKRPWIIVGGDHYCFKLEGMNIVQAVLVGNPRYPFAKSLTHFRDEFRTKLKSYVTDEFDLELDAAATFISINSNTWTLKGSDGEQICLQPKNTTITRQFCLYDIVGVAEKWGEISGITRGCEGVTKIVEANFCDLIHSPNDESNCNSDGMETTTIDPNFENSTSSTEFLSTSSSEDPEESTTDSSYEEVTTDDYEDGDNKVRTNNCSEIIPSTTTEPPIEEEKIKCDIGFQMYHVRKYWASDEISSCPKSITELLLSDQLKRLAVLNINRLIPSRLESLAQSDVLLGLTADVMKMTCPRKSVPPDFIDAAVEAFTMFIWEDFTYQIVQTDDLLFSAIVDGLKTCYNTAMVKHKLMEAKGRGLFGRRKTAGIPAATTTAAPQSFGFDFVVEPNECNTSVKISPSGKYKKIVIDPTQSWRNYEIIIESVWKMLINARSYCHDDLIDVYNRNEYSIRMMKLFSPFIYEKWFNPLATNSLYKFVLPHGDRLEEIMDNLDLCVGSLNFFSEWEAKLNRNPFLEYDILDPFRPRVEPKHSSGSQGMQSRALVLTQVERPVEKAQENLDEEQQEQEQEQGQENEEERDWEFKIKPRIPEEMLEEPGSNELSESEMNFFRRKRGALAWQKVLEENRNTTLIWDNTAHCIQTTEEPSYLLGFSRCAHP